ncbi:MAG: lipid-binding SYLF domain-containing protein [Candidatus Omnitrophota bacterium]
MKRKILSFVSLAGILSLIVLPSSGYAQNTELDRRVWEANKVMQEIMMAPDLSIPEELLGKCKAIAIYPSVVKGAFIFGAKFGKGVVLARDEKTGKWGPVAFSTIGGGSFGFQIGGSATDMILVVMNDRGLDGLLSSNFTLGADAAVAAGPVGRNTEAVTDATLRAGVLSYSRSRGLFGGVALDGAVLTEDNNSNALYYGRPVTSRDILQGGKAEVAASSIDLVNNLNDYSGRWAKRTTAK